ncbi:MAG TPA: isochorismatase family protein [Crinalium sp.]
MKRNALALAKTAKVLNIPVVLTSSQEENLRGLLLPELQDILPEAFQTRIRRAGIVNTWDDLRFKDTVVRHDRKNIIMAGVTTDVCLVYPAISARQEGYDVQAVMDTSGSPFDISDVLPKIGWPPPKPCP